MTKILLNSFAMIVIAMFMKRVKSLFLTNQTMKLGVCNLFLSW